jgi:hypothetical protein
MSLRQHRIYIWSHLARESGWTRRHVVLASGLDTSVRGRLAVRGLPSVLLRCCCCSPCARRGGGGGGGAPFAGSIVV